MKYTLFMYTGISQTQAVVYRRARHCEPQCMAHALSSYHGPHRMNDTTFCRLRDIWARQEHASQRTEIDKYIKKMWQHQEQYSRKMVDFRSDVIVLSAKISQTPDKRLNIICQRKLAWMRLAVRCLSQLFDDDIFLRTILFFPYVISNRFRSILIGSSIFMPLSRSHMVGISKAFKLLGNYCDELRKLFSRFQLANFTVDIFWLQREFYRQIKTMCPSYFIYLCCFCFFFVVVAWLILYH